MARKRIIVFDNGGITADCYTGVVISTGDVVGFNDHPQHPAYGFGQYCGNVTDRMNVTYGYGWRRHFDENKVLKSELKYYLNEARSNPEWLGKEVDINQLSDNAKKYLDNILTEE